MMNDAIKDLNPENENKPEEVTKTEPDKQDSGQITETPKKKRGRPKGSTNRKKKKDAEFPLEVIKPFAKAPFDILAARWGDHWKLSAVEVNEFAKAMAPVVNKYAPVLFDKYGAELGFALATISLIAPRISAEREIRKAKKVELTEEDNAASS